MSCPSEKSFPNRPDEWALIWARTASCALYARTRAAAAVRIATTAAAMAETSSGVTTSVAYWGLVAMSAVTMASTAPQKACWLAVVNTGWVLRMLEIWFVVRETYLPLVEYWIFELPRAE